MIEVFISYIQPIVFEYGALGVFLATLLEEIIAPIPSAIVPLSAGFLLLPVTASLVEIIWRALLIIALPVSLGVTIGSLIVYSIGFFGGKPAILKSKRWTGLSWEDLKKIKKKLTRGNSDIAILFILRMIPVIPGVAISGVCGISRYRLKAFILVTFLGSFMRAFVLGVIGFYVGIAYANYSEVISKVEKYIFVTLIIAVLVFVFYSYIKKHLKVNRNQCEVKNNNDD